MKNYYFSLLFILVYQVFKKCIWNKEHEMKRLSSYRFVMRRIEIIVITDIIIVNLSVIMKDLCSIV